jgi:hypothetical protein
MFKIFGENYYLDVDKIDSYIGLNPASGGTEQHISIAKYELIKTMIEVLMTEQDESDELLGSKASNGVSLPFKIAFNTLLRHNLLQHL